jgi:hypothetical protein
MLWAGLVRGAKDDALVLDHLNLGHKGPAVDFGDSAQLDPMRRDGESGEVPELDDLIGFLNLEFERQAQSGALVSNALGFLGEPVDVVVSDFVPHGFSPLPDGDIIVAQCNISVNTFLFEDDSFFARRVNPSNPTM